MSTPEEMAAEERGSAAEMNADPSADGAACEELDTAGGGADPHAGEMRLAGLTKRSLMDDELERLRAQVRDEQLAAAPPDFRAALTGTGTFTPNPLAAADLCVCDTILYAPGVPDSLGFPRLDDYEDRFTDVRARAVCPQHGEVGVMLMVPRAPAERLGRAVARLREAVRREAVRNLTRWVLRPLGHGLDQLCTRVLLHRWPALCDWLDHSPLFDRVLGDGGSWPLGQPLRREPRPLHVGCVRRHPQRSASALYLEQHPDAVIVDAAGSPANWRALVAAGLVEPMPGQELPPDA